MNTESIQASTSNIQQDSQQYGTAFQEVGASNSHAPQPTGPLHMDSTHPVVNQDVCLPQLSAVLPPDPVTEDTFHVWIVGSSMVRDAFYHATDKNLGLSQIGGVVEWKFKPGLREHQLFPLIQEMSTDKPLPYLIVIHCGGNGLGQAPLGHIQLQLKQSVESILRILPSTRIVCPQLYRGYITETKLITINWKKPGKD
ncbi:uncharacterized protein LOC128557091 [Mercenaria mercenaria]|uniref:uncharacterized protein LOC128557091 n=1 Tax=Mercenaria mercenaria TaxID=6596 RepID=UPI00234F9AC8|nr:uncharacterized protein LOC128557091 [Mercenaria mercenaria]